MKSPSPKKQDSPKNKVKFERYMRTPCFYQVFTRYLVSLCLALLWDTFINTGTVKLPKSSVFTFFALFFAVMAWFAYLRMDGVKAPKFDRKLFLRPKKRPGNYADMIDFVDEKPIGFEELDDDEKDLALLVADLITCVLFVITSFIYV